MAETSSVAKALHTRATRDRLSARTVGTGGELEAIPFPSFPTGLKTLPEQLVQ